ncbi:Ribosomal small subunit assembly protein [Rasamsonia emersonii CBS 393.64]|uniref:Ribosomal small subunit assembly protein n=1 Tax=Rasamsonia emersonii (strain ATCC 16479 / CBS 393.64 / IMI 116815) TaxID=1408163 RepID=A0A0F4YRU7_RASE3|nr:Ribosomal small subunit assembly protein [Rasamsonia emersonii CBS 393.64]KKA20576.1 Ribosomal small subunit assembly protein [Rasamsonia emersonii CBS 393.64]
MPKKVLEISGYTVLPLQFPPVASLPKPATHHLYLHPHEPRNPDPDAARSLFLVNLPIDTTEAHLRHLFAVQLSAGRVERVEFEGVPTKQQPIKPAAKPVGSTKKRKRVTADELQNQLEEINLPSTWDRQLHVSGSHAVVVFVDKPAMEMSLKAAKKAAKNGTTIVWGEGIEDRVPPLGVKRYKTHNSLRYPPRDELLRIVNDYMAIFTQAEEARARELARKAQEPDEDGFITVTRGPKNNSIAREEEIKELIEKQKKREAGLEDFYRFQTREKKKERQNELLKKFEEDKKKLEEIKKMKGRIRDMDGVYMDVNFPTRDTFFVTYFI